MDMASKCSSIDECMKQWISSPKKYQLKKVTGVELTKQSELELNSERACGFCIFVMTKYQSVVAQNKTETELLDYLESACKLLPSQDLQKQVNLAIKIICDLDKLLIFLQIYSVIPK